MIRRGAIRAYIFAAYVDHATCLVYSMITVIGPIFVSGLFD